MLHHCSSYSISTKRFILFCDVEQRSNTALFECLSVWPSHRTLQAKNCCASHLICLIILSMIVRLPFKDLLLKLTASGRAKFCVTLYILYNLLFGKLLYGKQFVFFCRVLMRSSLKQVLKAIRMSLKPSSN